MATTIDGGAPLIFVAQALGHTHTRMVDKRYAHLAPSYVADTIRSTAPDLDAQLGHLIPHFQFAERKDILAQQRKDEKDERVRTIAAQRKASSDLKDAFCAYLESIGSHPHVYVSSDVAFTVTVGRIGFQTSTNRDKTFDFVAEVESGGRKRIYERSLIAEAVTDALLKVCHPELNS